MLCDTLLMGCTNYRLNGGLINRVSIDGPGWDISQFRLLPLLNVVKSLSQNLKGLMSSTVCGRLMKRALVTIQSMHPVYLSRQASVIGSHAQRPASHPSGGVSRVLRLRVQTSQDLHNPFPPAFSTSPPPLPPKSAHTLTYTRPGGRPHSRLRSPSHLRKEGRLAGVV